MQKYEEEKMRLNELGLKSLEKGIPLARNEAVQAQSRKVDELIIRFYLQESVVGGSKEVNIVARSGKVMEFPSWFQSAIQERLFIRI